MSEAVEIPKGVYDDINRVYHDHRIDVRNVRRLLLLLMERGAESSAEWIREHQQEYYSGWIKGFKKTD